MHKRAERVAWTLPPARQALARGDYSSLRWDIDELLKVFRINLDPNSASYRELGSAMLRAYVKSIEAVALRGKGEGGETTRILEAQQTPWSSRRTLRAAY